MAQAVYSGPFGGRIEKSERLNMNHIHLSNQKAARILTVVCGLLFCAFSFIYLYVFQGDVLEALLRSWSDRVVCSPWVVALLVTVILLILRWGINVLLGLKGHVRALSYFPSFLLLGVMTDVDYTLYDEGIASRWAWLLPLVLLVFILVGFALRRLCRQWMDAPVDNAAMATSNLTLFLLLCFLTVGIGNTDIHLHHELAIARAVRNHDYPEARKIGAKVVDPNRAFTALRAYALSAEGTLGEYLFQYPQPYGAEGLLPDATGGAILPTSVAALYAHWGEQPREGEQALPFFRRLYQAHPQRSELKEYYLCALLLHKDLDTFVSLLRESGCDASTLPRHYREALYLYARMHPHAGVVVTDESLEQAWKRYEEFQAEYSQVRGEANLMRRKCGETYWWYYQY